VLAAAWSLGARGSILLVLRVASYEARISRRSSSRPIARAS
jgi:hypothetical protein